MFEQFLERESYTGTEKLKGISVDRVSYIQIETEAIRDFNDKQ